MGESEIKKSNRKMLTEYWEAHGVVFAPGETIDDCIVVPGDKTDWTFYPIIEWLKKRLRRA